MSFMFDIDANLEASDRAEYVVQAHRNAVVIDRGVCLVCLGPRAILERLMIA